MDIRTQGSKGRVGQIRRLGLTYIYNTMCKIDSWWERAIKYRKLTSVLRDDLERKGKGWG